MKDSLDKVVSLGFGLIMAGKEQVEKTVDEWVAKGEISRAESAGVVENIVQKGNEARSELEATILAQVQKMMSNSGLATKEEVAVLERRVQELEEKLASSTNEN